MGNRNTDDVANVPNNVVVRCEALQNLQDIPTHKATEKPEQLKTSRL
jgi:hypothetical protein